MLAGRRLAAALIVLAALASGLGYTLGARQSPEHAIHVELYVYKNGKLVYYDPDDPATRNFVRYIAGLFMVDPPDVTLTDGSTRDPDEVHCSSYSYYYQHGGPTYVAVSNDTITYSRSLTSLNFMVKVKVDDTSIQVGDNYIQISSSINIQSPMNITYVALLVQQREDDGKLLLLFADPLEQPVAVQSGDVVTVVYKIVFP